MTPSLPRRDLLRLAALIAGGAVVPALASCAATPAQEAALAISKVPRRSPEPLTRSSVDRFGAALLDGLGGGNVVVSPLSVAIVLAMLGTGAAGETRAEFEAVLGSGIDDLNEEFNALLLTLDGTGARDGLELTLANALWAQHGLALQPPFLDALAGFYGAGVRQVDFAKGTQAAIDAINAWADQSTKGLIPVIVDESMIKQDTRLALGNAIHFKGSWEQQFLPQLSAPRPFTTGSGATVNPTMMFGDASMWWLETPEWTGAALPFAGGEVAMALLLPKPGAPATLAGLTASAGLAELFAAPRGRAMVTMPRWKARTNKQLKSILTSLGLRAAFDPGRADFSGLTGATRLVLDFVVHEATVTVDETGAEAAAVTVAGFVETSGPSRALLLDRPFYWAITHVPTATALFLGRVDDPTR